jgi:hypothetical protein
MLGALAALAVLASLSGPATACAQRIGASPGQTQHPHWRHSNRRGDFGSPTTAERETAYATVAAAVIGLGALFGAWRTLRQNRSTARRRLTHEWVARISDLGLIPHRAVMSSFLRGGMRPPEISLTTWARMGDDARKATGPAMWKRLDSSSTPEDRLTLHQITAFPNALEALASMYNDKLLDKDIVERQAEALARGFWTVANEWWMPLLRPNPDSALFKDLKQMLDSLEKRRKRPRWQRWLRIG